MREWRVAKKTGRMEVDHRVPCRGKHGLLSCDHHLDNLETLCTACHRDRTSADRKTRAEVDEIIARQTEPSAVQNPKRAPGEPAARR